MRIERVSVSRVMFLADTGLWFLMAIAFFVVSVILIVGVIVAIMYTRRLHRKHSQLLSEASPLLSNRTVCDARCSFASSCKVNCFYSISKHTGEC